MNPIYQQRKMCEIILPGTHDSMTYDLATELGPDATSIISKLFNTFSIIRPYIKNMATTQGVAYDQQMAAGIRYFDARIALDSSGTLRFTHSLLSTQTVADALAKTGTFLDANTDSIIVWKVGYKAANQANRQATTAQFIDLLNSQNIPYQYFDDTSRDALTAFTQCNYVDVIAGNQRFILIVDDLIVNTYRDADTSPSEVDATIYQMSATAQPQPFEVQLILPVANSGYVLGALKYLSEEGFWVFVGVAAALAMTLGAVWAPLGPLMAVGTAVAYLYFKNSSWPTSIQEIQDNTGIIIFHDYYNYLHINKTEACKPMFMIIDFFPSDYVAKSYIMTSSGSAC